MATFRKVQLLVILEDLSAKDFKKFQWYLNDKILDGFTPIPKSKLENADRQDTVDTMVETYGMDRALKITVEILRTMTNNDLVQRIEAEWRAGLSDEYKHKFKEELQTDLGHLEENVKKLKEVQQSYIQFAGHIKTQAENTERNIKEEFKKLHQFLQEEEEARIAAVRKEKEEKTSERVKVIEGRIASLSDTIKAMEEELRGDISFLANLKTTEQRDQCTLLDPQLDSGALIDEAKHLGNLAFRVWEKMKGVVKFTSVILDPNTASGWLSLSDDLTSVRNTNTKQLPNNPERFTEYSAVLGSEGFSSGKHSWEVEVGDHPDWILGMARESVNRKGEIVVTPGYGMWCIMLDSDEVINGLGETLSLKRRPQRIRVQLDCDKGKVSFYDPEDMTHIYTCTVSYTEKLYPFFSIGKAADAKHPEVTILQSELSVSVMSS